MDHRLYYELRWDSGFVDGFENLSPDFCNKPVCVNQEWKEEGPVAMILLCGRLYEHEGGCDPIPPLSDVQG